MNTSATYESDDGQLFDLDEDGRVSLPIAPDLKYLKRRDTFQTPGDEMAEHIGRPFEIVGVDFSIDRLIDGGGGPLFMIRFPDGAEIDATEEEVFEDGGWNPPW